MDNNPDMEEAVGLRFRPTEEELITPYLLKKIHDNKNVDDMIPDIDIYTTPPWDIPSLIVGCSQFQTDPDEVYFFCRVRYMSSSGKKVHRKDKFGFWKCTGPVRTVKARDRRTAIAWKNILVYKKDDDPDDAPTEYSMHEYHLNDDLAKDAPTDTRDVVLCALKRNWDKQAKGKAKGRRSMSEGINQETPRAKRCKAKEGGKKADEETPRAKRCKTKERGKKANEETPRVKKRKAKERGRKATDQGSPNNTTCPELSPTGCNVVNAADNQIATEPIAEVSTPSAIETPQSILSPSLPSSNTSPALSPITCAYIQGEEAPFPYTIEVNPKKPETPHEVWVGNITTTYEENPSSALITGTEIADCCSIEVPHQELMESGPQLPLTDVNHFPLHHIETELDAEYEPLVYQRYFNIDEPPPSIFQLLGQ